MDPNIDLIAMKVTARRALTAYIDEFVLQPVDDRELSSFGAGSHITVETPSGAMRRYSLVGDGSPASSYTIAVKREADSRGGSSSMHEDAKVGTILNVGAPENNFQLRDASKYLLIAGGIGVTPIYAMAQHLDREGKAFRIIYCTRSAEDTAYLDEMMAAFGSRLTVHHDDGDPDKLYDFWDHFEDDVAFDVELAKSGATVMVPEDRSILEALRDAGFKTVSSCESGTCGTCKSRMLAGEADHRDMVLMDEEKDDYIMICVSRARAGGLVLDL